MVNYTILLSDSYVIGVAKSDHVVKSAVSEEYAEQIEVLFRNKPTDPEGYQYRLRADTLEWELVELPPVPEYEPTIEDKAEAYDILMGVNK